MSYEIRDASGALVAIHDRIHTPSGKQFAWRLPDGGRDLAGIPVADLPLYKSERIGDWPGEIVVAEGEKATDVLVAAGVPAVGTVTGAHATPSLRVLAELGGHPVVLWPDADDIGRKHMARIAAMLKPICPSVRWVDRPSAPQHEDAADLPSEVLRIEIDAAGGLPPDEEFERVGLGYRARFRSSGAELALDRITSSGGDIHGMLTAVHRGEHIMFGRFNVSSITTRKTWANMLRERAKDVDWMSHLETFCVSALQAETRGEPVILVGRRPPRDTVPYLLYPILPRDRATIVFGPGGTGKSFLAAYLAVSVRTGLSTVKGWTVQHPASVLVLDWEADEDEWNDRIGAISRGMGIPPPEIHYRSCTASLTDMVDHVARDVAEASVGLVIIDSVGMATPSNREGSDANEGALRLFKAIRYLKASVLLIDHVTGADVGRHSPILKPYGSVFKANLARSVFELRNNTPVEGEPATMHLGLYHRKVNGGSLLRPQGLYYGFGENELTVTSEELAAADMLPNMKQFEQIEHLLLIHHRLSVAQLAEILGKTPEIIRSQLNRFKDDRFVKLDETYWGLYHPDEKDGTAA